MNRIRYWTVRRSRRRVAGYWEIRSTHDIVGICYGTREEPSVWRPRRSNT